MANKTRSSALSLISFFVVLVAITGQSVAGRNVPENSKKDEKKQPEWWFGRDKSFLIPGFGRVIIPPLGHGHGHHVPPYSPYPDTGSNGGSGAVPSGGSGSGSGAVPPVGSGSGSGAVPPVGSGSGSAPGSHDYVPGGDDTFAPNPGYEVPTPGNVCGNAPASTKP